MEINGNKKRGYCERLSHTLYSYVKDRKATSKEILQCKQQKSYIQQDFDMLRTEKLQLTRFCPKNTYPYIDEFCRRLASNISMRRVAWGAFPCICMLYRYSTPCYKKIKINRFEMDGQSKALSVSLSIYMCVYVQISVSLSIYLSNCLYIYLSNYLPVCLFAWCFFVYLSIYLSVLSICLSISLSVCLYIILSICLSIYLSIYLSVQIPIHLCVYLSVCLSVYVYICISLCISVWSNCLSVYLSILLSVYLYFYLSICHYLSHLFQVWYDRQNVIKFVLKRENY